MRYIILKKSEQIVGGSTAHTTRYVCLLSLVGIGGELAEFRSTLAGLHIKVLYILFLVRGSNRLVVLALHAKLHGE